MIMGGVLFSITIIIFFTWKVTLLRDHNEESLSLIQYVVELQVDEDGGVPLLEYLSRFHNNKEEKRKEEEVAIFVTINSINACFRLQRYILYWICY